jgi:phosphatidylinositol glycan class M
LGLPSFVPGLYLAGLFFFSVNAWILGIIVKDGGYGAGGLEKISDKSKAL